MVFLSFSFLFGIISIFASHSFYIFINFSIVCFNIGFNLILVWTLEILPTVIRDYGTGIFYTFNNIGSVVAQFIYISIAKKSLIFTLLFYSILSLILMIFIYFLPNTQSKDLDSDLDLLENEEENESKID